MRFVVAAVAIWSAFVVALLVFEPGYQPGLFLGCMGLIGRTAACESGQATINDAWWWLHILPGFIAIASGYVAIALLAVRRRRGAAGAR